MRKAGIKKAVTIHDVAAAVGISAASVSRALSGKDRISAQTRQDVLEAAQELGYEANVQAQNLRRGHSNLIYLFSLELVMGLGMRKLQMIQSLLYQRGYQVPLHAYGYSDIEKDVDQKSLMRSLWHQKPRAIVCSVGRMKKDAFVELNRYQEAGGVVVCYDAPVEVACDQVIFDRQDNTYQATRYLLELGHRRIGYFEVGNSRPSGPRVEGLQCALSEYGVQVRPEWLFFGGHSADYEEAGEHLAQQFLQLPPAQRPSALSIVNDYVALAFMSVVQQAGLRVPQDVSVVGCDNRTIARHSNPPLTTISQPMEAIARGVVDTVCERLEGRYEGSPRRMVLRGELVKRQSTAEFLTTKNGSSEESQQFAPR